MTGPEPIIRRRPSSTTARYGTRTIRFETGRLARQAAGSAVAYLDEETMLLSATTAGKHPKEQLRLLPAHGRRRGADVRRRAHPGLVLPPRGPSLRGRDPHLPADRPAAAADVRLGPAQRGAGRHHRAWRCIPTSPTTYSPSTRPRCRPSCPVCRSAALSAATRVALDRRSMGRVPDPQPDRGRPSSTWSSLVASLDDGDVAIMMVEAESTEATWDLVRGGAQAPTEEIVAEGLEASKAFIKQLCEAQSAARRPGRQAGAGVPGLPGLRGGRARCRRPAPSPPISPRP